eukprot:NODE_288_length_10680_cov_0.431245.p8 type:complete len:177 gc:universal NODE_288_length_10680_cov_0.431245:10412-9882(-)
MPKSIEEIKATRPGKTLIDQIPSYEQQRIIQESGILNANPSQHTPTGKLVAIAAVTGFIISCMQLFLEQLVHQQYVQDVDIKEVFRRWPIISILWGVFVFFSTRKYSNIYLTIAHVISAFYSMRSFSKLHPTYGETYRLASIISLCAFSSFQLDIKPLAAALILEAFLYFLVIKSY